MNVVARLRRRFRMARAQAPSLRVPFVLAPVQRRAQVLAEHRLRRLGVARPRTFLRELGDVHAHTRRAEAEYYAAAPGFHPGAIGPLEGAVLYALVRSLRPREVVETGTANGFSTTYLLAALRRNVEGTLHSIDLPFEAGAQGALQSLVDGTSIEPDDASPLPPGRRPGWAVPDELRGRWDLALGDARELLPALLGELGEIDLFFHDSLHTRGHMLFEFETAWPRLREGGILVADDIFQRKHDAFPAFARSVGRRFSTFGNLGLIRK